MAIILPIFFGYLFQSPAAFFTSTQQTLYLKHFCFGNPMWMTLTLRKWHWHRAPALETDQGKTGDDWRGGCQVMAFPHHRQKYWQIQIHTTTNTQIQIHLTRWDRRLRNELDTIALVIGKPAVIDDWWLIPVVTPIRCIGGQCDAGIGGGGDGLVHSYFDYFYLWICVFVYLCICIALLQQ